MGRTVSSCCAYWAPRASRKWTALTGMNFYGACSVGVCGKYNDAGFPAKHELTTRVKYRAPAYFSFCAPATSNAGRVRLRRAGQGEWWLVLMPGYLWDGPSFGPDNSRTCIAALAHDAMYTLLRQNHLSPWKVFRRFSDRWHHDLLCRWGFPRPCARLFYVGLRLCGRSSARYQ